MKHSTDNLELISKAEYFAPSVLGLGSIEAVVLLTGGDQKTDGEIFTS